MEYWPPHGAIVMVKQLIGPTATEKLYASAPPFVQAVVPCLAGSNAGGKRGGVSSGKDAKPRAKREAVSAESTESAGDTSTYEKKFFPKEPAVVKRIKEAIVGASHACGTPLAAPRRRFDGH